MWQFLGAGIGAALAMGIAGRSGQHWAVRVLCGAGAMLLPAALVVAWLFGGKDSPAGDVLVWMVLAFVLVVGALCVARLGPWLKARAGKVAAGAVLLLVALLVAWLFGGKEPAGEAVAAVPSESAPAVVQVEKAEPESCLCSQGAACVGPRGGRYCLSDAGVKRYMQGADK